MVMVMIFFGGGDRGDDDGDDGSLVRFGEGLTASDIKSTFVCLAKPLKVHLFVGQDLCKCVLFCPLGHC